MIVTCPSCETHFSVPEAAIGPRGRTLRCARCGHKWHFAPPLADEPIPLEMAPAAPPPSAAPVLESVVAPAAPAPGGLLLDSDSIVPDETLDEDEDGTEPKPVADPFAHIADLMMKGEPEPIPDLFSSPPVKAPARRRGGLGLWLLFVILLIGAAAIGLYLLQDRVIEHYPAAARYYEQIGLRSRVVGAGLTFRNIDSERVMQNDSEVLIVRGVIANTTDRTRDIPPLRLALYNNDKPLQEKIIQPPQPRLDPKASIGFRVTLERPDADATRFEVTFGLAPAAPAGAPPANPSSPPAAESAPAAAPAAPAAPANGH